MQPPPQQPQQQYQYPMYNRFMWQQAKKDGFLIASAVMAAISLALFLVIAFLWLVNKDNPYWIISVGTSIFQIAIAWVATWFVSFVLVVVALLRR
jgi:hypothetical protein